MLAYAMTFDPIQSAHSNQYSYLQHHWEAVVNLKRTRLSLNGLTISFHSTSSSSILTRPSCTGDTYTPSLFTCVHAWSMHGAHGFDLPHWWLNVYRGARITKWQFDHQLTCPCRRHECGQQLHLTYALNRAGQHALGSFEHTAHPLTTCQSTQLARRPHHLQGSDPFRQPGCEFGKGAQLLQPPPG